MYTDYLVGVPGDIVRMTERMKRWHRKHHPDHPMNTRLDEPFLIESVVQHDRENVIAVTLSDRVRLHPEECGVYAKIFYVDHFLTAARQSLGPDVPEDGEASQGNGAA